MSADATPQDRLKVAAALCTVYLVWGSTYYAIAVVLETMPPFLSAGLRFLVAGSALFLVGRALGGEAPTRKHWRSGFILGALMFVGGNGGVVWAEQHVPSGLTAVLIAVVPAWMVLIDWLRPRGTRPGAAVLAGLAVGTLGVAVLVNPFANGSAERVHPMGALVLMISSASWATGSMLSRTLPLPRSALVSTALQMMGGGVGLLVLAALFGEMADPGVLLRGSGRSWAALAYLALVGSIVAFTAYVWLLKHTTPALAATYAYVNPIVAVLIGAALAGERLTPRTLVASALIIGAIALITTARALQSRR